MYDWSFVDWVCDATGIYIGGRILSAIVIWWNKRQFGKNEKPMDISDVV